MLTTILTTTMTAALLTTAIVLPGGPPVGMDYLAYDRATDRIWVPAGNTGAVDVVDVATGKVNVIGGLPTAPASGPGRRRVGPSSAAVADGVVWVGNRADNLVAGFDARTLARTAAVHMPAMPDGVAYCRSTRELWVTLPGDDSIAIASLASKSAPAVATLKLKGQPEGYAVDDGRGLFYTNLENRDRTLAIDIKTRKMVADWPAACGAEGPRGLALDVSRRWLFVACTNGVQTLDVGHGGKILGRLMTGAGVDNPAYDPDRRQLFIASGATGQMTIAHVDDGGVPRAIRVVPTAKGARNPVLDGRGKAYVEDAAGGRLLVIDPLAN